MLSASGFGGLGDEADLPPGPLPEGKGESRIAYYLKITITLFEADS